MICIYHYIIFGLINSRRVNRADYIARKGEERSAYRLLVGKPEGNSLSKAGCRRENYNEMQLQEWGSGNGICWLSSLTVGRIL